jgi:hypothetical protein
VTKTSLDPGSFFNGVPGPTPWYPTPGDLAVEGFHWERSSGRTLLVGNAGVVAVLNYYNYVMRLDSSTLLIWNQRNETDYQGAPPVHLVVIQPGLLPPFGDNLKGAVSQMQRADTVRLALTDPPSVSMYFNTGVIGENLSAVFPSELQAIEELLILCNSSAISARDDGINANLALLVAKPNQSSYQLFPQDWFNSSDSDFGFQWVTRVARDPQTGRVRGEGFRIDPFELDDTLRKVARAS